MKVHIKSRVILFLLTLGLLITTNRCAKDPCYDTISPQYEVGIRFEITVLDSDGDPVEGQWIQIELQKKHCKGDLGTLFNPEGQTGSNGIYNPAITYSFKMNNTLDVLNLKITAPGAGAATESFDYNGLLQYSGSVYTFRKSFVRD